MGKPLRPTIESVCASLRKQIAHRMGNMPTFPMAKMAAEDDLAVCRFLLRLCEEEAAKAAAAQELYEALHAVLARHDGNNGVRFEKEAARGRRALCAWKAIRETTP